MRAKFINESDNYWNESPPYFPEYNSFWNELVPDNGSADTLQGEILRMMSRIMYDYYNNGLGNNKKEETIFLNNHKELFKEYMNDPSEWERFYNLYSEINFGNYDEMSNRRERNYYDEDEDDDSYYTDNYVNRHAKHFEKYMDDIMDGIIKYIRLTHNNLEPLHK